VLLDFRAAKNENLVKKRRTAADSFEGSVQMKAKRKAGNKRLKKGKKLSATKTLSTSGGRRLNPQPLPP
jgi:hypothetical protein